MRLISFVITFLFQKGLAFKTQIIFNNRFYFIQSISFRHMYIQKENRSSKIIHIKSKKDLKRENNETLYKHRKQNRWPKRNVPRSVVENYEPNGYKTNELEKRSVLDEHEKSPIPTKRNKRHTRRFHQSSNETLYKVILVYYSSENCRKNLKIRISKNARM